MTARNPTMASGMTGLSGITTELTQTGADRPENLLTIAVLERLFVLTKTVGAMGTTHPSALESAGMVRDALAAAKPPFSLQFVREATFRDRMLLPLDLEGFQRSQVLSRAVSNCGVQEVTFEALPESADLLQLAHVLARGAQGPTDWLESLVLNGISWREIAGAGWGAAAQAIDADLFAVTQLALAIAEAERLVGLRHEPWAWTAGVGVVRRLERALEVDSAAADRALELAPAPWSAGRRAVAVTLRVVAVLREVGAQAGTTRAAGHAAFVLGVHGMAPGLPGTVEGKAPAFEEAAGLALPHLLETSMETAGGAARHRIRVCALLNAIHRRTAFHGRWVGAIGLLDVMYELERRRQNDRQKVQLSLADLLAGALAEADSKLDPGWLRALVATVGELPPGARVRLADGRVGVVLEAGPSGDPWRPIVLIQGQMVEPPQPVRLQAAVVTARKPATQTGS